MIGLFFFFLILFAIYCKLNKAQFNPATTEFIKQMDATSYFTSGHEAVFEFNSKTNETWNIYEKFCEHDR